VLRQAARRRARPCVDARTRRSEHHPARNAMALPKSYRTIEDFQREELRPSNKVGFSFDDLMQETMLHENDLLFDDQRDEYEVEDDDDDY
jgi:hypothetical protein